MRLFRCLLALLVFLAIGTKGQAMLLAGWDFQTTTSGGNLIQTNPNTQTLFFANVGLSAGSAALYLNGANGSSTWNATSELTAVSGSANNTQNTTLSNVTTSPAALALQNGLSGSANNKMISFALPTLGYKDVVLTYMTQRTTTGFTTGQWSYSLNGTGFTDFGAPIAPPLAFTLQTIDFSSIVALNNQTLVYFRYQVSGGNITQAAGNNRLDNIRFDAIPEPSAALVACFGSWVFLARRRRQA